MIKPHLNNCFVDIVSKNLYADDKRLSLNFIETNVVLIRTIGNERRIEKKINQSQINFIFSLCKVHMLIRCESGNTIFLLLFSRKLSHKRKKLTHVEIREKIVCLLTRELSKCLQGKAKPVLGEQLDP